MHQEVADKIISRDVRSIQAEIDATVLSMLLLNSVLDPRWDIRTKKYNSLCLELCRMTGEMSRANFDLF